MIWIATTVIIFIIFIILFIFAPKSKNFYSYEVFYPKKYIFEDNINIIKKEIENLKDDDWIDYYGKDLWGNDKTNFKIFPLYMYDKYIKNNIIKCLNLFLCTNLSNVKNIFLAKLDSKTRLNEFQEIKKLANNTLRCCIGIKMKTFGNKKVGIWVNGEIKEVELGKLLIFDSSKKHSLYNETKESCVLLIIDINRPNYIQRGESNIDIPKDYDSFVEKILHLDNSVTHES